MSAVAPTTAIALAEDVATLAANVEAARMWLASCTSVRSAKSLRDKAAAMVAWVRARDGSVEAHTAAAEVMLWSERRIGELLKADPPKAKGAAEPGTARGTRRGNNSLPRQDPAPEPTLADQGLTKMQSSRYQEAASLPEEEFVEHVEATKKAGERLTSGKVRKLAKRHAAKKEKATTAKAGRTAKLDASIELYCCAVADLAQHVKPASIDCIITDPPYPREFLPVYAELGKLAAIVLKPGGSCVVMCGQSYLPEVMAALCEHLKYHWTLAYLTPGGQAPHLYERKVNTAWKPLLWLTVEAMLSQLRDSR